jgi:hypothetical protein
MRNPLITTRKNNSFIQFIENSKFYFAEILKIVPLNQSESESNSDEALDFDDLVKKNFEGDHKRSYSLQVRLLKSGALNDKRVNLCKIKKTNKHSENNFHITSDSDFCYNNCGQRNNHFFSE